MLSLELTNIHNGTDMKVQRKNKKKYMMIPRLSVNVVWELYNIINIEHLYVCLSKL